MAAGWSVSLEYVSWLSWQSSSLSSSCYSSASVAWLSSLAVMEGDLLIMDTVYMDNSANLTVLCWESRELFVLLWGILLLQNLGKYIERGELSVVYNEKIITKCT